MSIGNKYISVHIHQSFGRFLPPNYDEIYSVFFQKIVFFFNFGPSPQDGGTW